MSVLVVHSPERARVLRQEGDVRRIVVIGRADTAERRLTGLSEHVEFDDAFDSHVKPYVAALARELAIGCNMAAKWLESGHRSSPA